MSEPVSREDYVDLQRFYAGQARAIDAGDARAWAGTFTPDGFFSSPSAGGRIAGTDALERFAASYAGGSDTRQYRHWSSQLEARYEPDGSICSTCYGMLLVIDPGGAPQLLRSSVHHDRLVRTKAGWRVAGRVIEPDAGAPALAAAQEQASSPQSHAGTADGRYGR